MPRKHPKKTIEMYAVYHYSTVTGTNVRWIEQVFFHEEEANEWIGKHADGYTIFHVEPVKVTMAAWDGKLP